MKELFYMEQQSITKYLLLCTLSTTFMEKHVKFPSAWAPAYRAQQIIFSA